MAASKAHLDKAHILVADRDTLICEVLRDALTTMGLANLTFVKSGRKAVEVLQRQPVDILITEWAIEPLDGIALVSTLRKSEDARLAMLPAIMLTARAEMADVIVARDTGITEFLVKPFTAKTLFNRLEHVIDFPRDFIVSDVYVGPDRRRIKAAKQQESERRTQVPAIVTETAKIVRDDSNRRPYRIVPAQALKKKMGILGSLDAVITPELLARAQEKITSFQDVSLNWIAQDLKRLEEALSLLAAGEEKSALEEAKEALLSIKSRAGTFNYAIASKLAFSFYGFMRNHFQLQHGQHLLVAKKHLEVLKIILANKVEGEGSALEQKLVEGLAQLVEKFQVGESLA